MKATLHKRISNLEQYSKQTGPRLFIDTSGLDAAIDNISTKNCFHSTVEKSIANRPGPLSYTGVARNKAENSSPLTDEKATLDALDALVSDEKE